MKDTIDHLIINSPYKVPDRYWKQNSATKKFEHKKGRRPAGYMMIDPTTDNGGEFIELKTVNAIRKRIDQWRNADYPGISTTTRKLIEHWKDNELRQFPLFFCQMEAVESLIWYLEGSEQYKQGIVLENDGGPFERFCNKMATGTGKTTVMAMIIAWQVLNAINYPKDRRFSKNVLIITPGITVKKRLQVLHSSHEQNYYDAFGVVPHSMKQKLRQMKLFIENWHTLMPLKEKNKSVVKKGAETDEAFCRRVLGNLSFEKNFIVINDEAHHAWRIPAELKIKKIKGVSKEDQEQATRWMEGLDRIHNKRKIIRCFDLSATPFAPTGKKTKGEALFPWIISDFGLSDAIEAGLVKTPQVVVRDSMVPDASTYKARLYHIYNDPEVKTDLNRKAKSYEPLPSMVQKAYAILSGDWLQVFEEWEKEGAAAPPVMLTVCNQTSTAARVEHFFNKGDCPIEPLNSKSRMLRVDSNILKKAESGESGSVNKAYEEKLHKIVEHSTVNPVKKKELLGLKKEELLREIIDNVGKPGKAGVNLQNVISVAMLSEGWDAKNVTHIMGLRAFSSQLLCEQVIGRGLRRASYEVDEETGLFEPEYVNIFGVPFEFLPHEGDGGKNKKRKEKTLIQALPELGLFEIKWPNIIRIEKVMRPKLSIDWSKVEPFQIKPSEFPLSAEMAPVVNGEKDISRLTKIDLLAIAEKFRLQHLVFQSVRQIFEQTYEGKWKGDKGYLVFQLFKIVEKFIQSDKIEILGKLNEDPLRKRVLLTLSRDSIVRHLIRFIQPENTQRLEPVFDSEQQIRSTADMPDWYTGKPCHPTQKSQITHTVFDSTWEAAEAYVIENSKFVTAYAKNDHLFFEVLYVYNGVVRKYRPDFLIKLTNGKTLVLEVKGRDNEQNRTKRDALDEWVIAVNAFAGFGKWYWDVSFSPDDIEGIIGKHS